MSQAKAANALIARAVAQGGVDALKGVKPVAFAAQLTAGTTEATPEIYYRPLVKVGPVVNPLFDALLLALGATRRGARSYSFSLAQNQRKHCDPVKLKGLIEVLPGKICFAGHQAEQIQAWQGMNPSRQTNVHHYASSLATLLHNATPLSQVATHQELLQHFSGHATPDTPEHHQAIVLSVANSQLHLRVCTDAPHQTWNPIPTLANMNRWRNSDRDEAALMTADRAIAMLEKLAADGFTVVDPSGQVAKVRKRLRSAVVLQAMHSSPGTARIVAGCRASTAGTKLKLVPFVESGGSTRHTVSSVTQAQELARIGQMKGSELIIDPLVGDVIAMELARPVEIDGARPYQNEAVAVHLSTRIGYLNACAVGLGKTPITLWAMRKKALDMVGYRGLVVTEAKVRPQWVEETAKFFPEARVRSFTSNEIKSGQLEKFLAAAGDDPAVAVLGYNTPGDTEKWLARTRWNDGIVDEGTWLAKPGSARTKAMWYLRKHAIDVAVVTTGTPIRKGLDDIGKALAWARNDEQMYHERLSQKIDMTHKDANEKLDEFWGPTVFRRDQSEIADQLPEVRNHTIVLDPAPEELALANGARFQLKAFYEELEEKLGRIASLNPGDPRWKKAQAEIQAVRGSVLGGVTLAKISCCDPDAVAVSTSLAAKILDSKGLIAPAVRKGSTKRRVLGEIVSQRVDRGDAILIFTESSRVARNVIADLAAEGIEAGLIAGGVSEKRCTTAKHRYQGVCCDEHKMVPVPPADCPDCTQPDLQVLVLTTAAIKGLNLQRTTVLVHFDLPWIPTDIVQRLGRASRFGSTAKTLEVISLILKGTIEERVVSVILPRAVVAMKALDTRRGVNAANTEMGVAIGGLQEVVSDTEKARLSKKDQKLFEMTKELIAA